MRIGVAMTVNNRPLYLKRALDAWAQVRHVDKVEFRFGVEPVEESRTNVALIQQWAEATGVDVVIRLNPEQFGSQHNPWEVMDASFKAGCKYVILTEDDLLPSTDLLEYHKWAAENGGGSTLVCSCNRHQGEDAAAVNTVVGFADCWIWGTWDFCWSAVVSPHWDHNYSTGDGAEKGWDWHLNKRVMQVKGWKSLQPEVSRVRSIGEQGEHSFGEVEPVLDWQQKIEPQEYLRIV